MSLLSRIGTKNLLLSKAFPFIARRHQSTSAVSAVLYPFPLGRRDPYSLPLKLTQRLDDPDDVDLDNRPISLRYRVFATLELSALDYAAEISRYAALRRFCSFDNHVPTCNAIIEAMCLAKRYDDAIALFHYFFNKCKIIPNTYSFNLIIQAHCDEGHVDDALQLYRYFNPDSDTYRLLAQGLVDAGRVDEAVGLARSTCVDWRVFNVLIGAFFNQGDYESGNELFLQVKETCNEKGIAFASCTFVDYWLEKGNWTKAMDYIPRTVDVLSGNKFLEVLFKHGETSLARQYFEEMLGECMFDSETINIVVNEYFRQGEYGEALETFKRSPPAIMCGSYANIIARFCESGRGPEAEALLEEMSSPDVVTFKAVIDAYVRFGRVDDALRVFTKMIASSLRKSNH